ncbi:MAG: NUDIX hydrolase [Candidatus Baltobacteraceae bacterium]
MKTYRRLSSREVYSNPYIRVEAHEVVHPNGRPGEYALLVPPPSSAVVVADGSDLLFARQPRFAAQAEVIEIVKGGANGGEDPLACAKRETREELGIEAAHWQHMGALYEIPSLVGTPVQLYFAHGVEHVDAEEGALESIELMRVNEDVAIEAAATGQINDAVTVAALLRYGIRSGRLRLGPP